MAVDLREADRHRGLRRRLWQLALVLPLLWRNLTSRRPVVAPGDGPVVSLTTFGPRTGRVFLAVESIARGAVLPSRLILWLDESEQLADPPRALRRLRRRGLEILATPDLGPHKKYFPYALSSDRHTHSLVTADDDTVYPRDWLARLVAAETSTPGHVIGYRARRFTFAADGQIAPYSSWPLVTDDDASPHVLPTGVSGVLYPPVMLEALRDAGEAFRTCAPRTDDIWLHATALRTGTPVRQIDRQPGLFPIVPGSQHESLVTSNVHGSGNDEALRATYTAAELDRLRPAAGNG